MNLGLTEENLALRMKLNVFFSFSKISHSLYPQVTTYPGSGKWKCTAMKSARPPRAHPTTPYH